MYIPTKFNKIISYNKQPQFYIEFDQQFFSDNAIPIGLDIRQYYIDKNNIQQQIHIIARRKNKNDPTEGWQILFNDTPSNETVFELNQFNNNCSWNHSQSSETKCLLIIYPPYFEDLTYTNPFTFKENLGLGDEYHVDACVTILNIQTNITESHTLITTNHQGGNAVREIHLIGKKFKILNVYLKVYIPEQ